MRSVISTPLHPHQEIDRSRARHKVSIAGNRDGSAIWGMSMLDYTLGAQTELIQRTARKQANEWTSLYREWEDTRDEEETTRARRRPSTPKTNARGALARPDLRAVARGTQDERYSA